MWFFGYEWSWVDGVLLLVAILYAWQAFERGVVPVINEMLAWIAAWYIGIHGYQEITKNLVIHLGLRASLVRPWSLLITVLFLQILIYRGLEELARKMKRHYFGKAAQVLIGILPALVCGVCFAGYVLLVLIALPLKFPFKTDLAMSVTGLKILESLPTNIIRQ